MLVQPGEKKINEGSDFILQASERVYGEVVLNFSNKHIVKGQAAVFIVCRRGISDRLFTKGVAKQVPRDEVEYPWRYSKFHCAGP